MTRILTAGEAVHFTDQSPMKQVWTQEELIEHWTLGASELVLLMNKSGIGRLGIFD